MRFVRILILALGLATIAAASSFAAVSFIATSTNNIVPINGQTALAGSILYTPLVPGTVNSGEIINITYPTAISYLPQVAVTLKYSTFAGGVYTSVVTPEIFGAGAAAPVSPTTAFASYGTTATSSSSGVSVTVSQTNLLISFGANVSFNAGDYLRVDGVRLDVNALNLTEFSTFSVNLSNTLGQATANVATLVIGTAREPLNTPTVTGVTTANQLSYFASTAVNGGQNLITITISEVFQSAFDTNATTKTWLQVALPNIPSGMTITGITLAAGNGTSATYANAYAPFGAGWTYTNPMLIAINSQSSSVIDSVAIGLTFGITSGTTSIALNPAAINVNATLNPAAPTNASGGPLYPYSNPIPAPASYQPNQYKFASRVKSTTIPVLITPLASNLFSVFSMLARNNTSGASPFLYNTGYAISNTSGSGFTYPAGLPGTITVTLYPQGGTPVSFTTSSNRKPGQFLDSNGNLTNGQTWIVLLNDLLTAAGYSSTADFYGFIRFRCNFQGAQGISYVSSSDPVTGEWSSSVAYPMVSDQVVF